MINMSFNKVMYYYAVIAVATAIKDGTNNYRSPKRIMNYVKPPKEHQDNTKYSICSTGGLQGACLSNAKCDILGGGFAGFCKGEDICCVVKETCGGTTSAHTALFQNPSYPKNDTEARVCPFTTKINRGMCAVRVDFKTFELARYEDGLCIRDTLTILGSTGGVATPVCGNMTSYATTFEVKELSSVVLAMVVQGVPAHKFSIQVTQLACRDIVTFQSPTFAGIRNDTAKVYNKPTTTTTTTTTTEAPTTTENVSDEEVETTTQFLPPVRNLPGPDHDDPDEEEEKEEEDKIRTTTLRTGILRNSTKASVVIKKSALDNYENLLDEPNNFGQSKKSSPNDGVYLETISKVSRISAFSKAYNSLFKTADDCKFEYTPKVTDIIKQTNIGQFRIIGGEYTNLNEYPWQVALVYKKKFFCGGSLISDRHILTAAHCIFGSFSKGIEHLHVSLGDMDLTTKNDTKNIVGRVKKVFWNLNYNPHTTNNDIGLFELETPVTFNYTVSAVKLPTDLNDLYEDADATVTGWGRYSATKKATSTVLKEYTGPLTPIDECVKRWSKFPGIDAKKEMHICLAVKFGTPCHGDSGGPLVVCSGPQCTQVGVVSFGFPLCTNVGLPAVFTRVSTYKRWIDISLSPLLYT